MFIIPLIAAGIGAAATAYGVHKQNQMQKEQAAKQMQFQERMSSTSWQRSVEDMKMAGINPMLSYMKGGASSPGGAMANVHDVVGPAVSTAMQAKRLVKELEVMDAQKGSAWAVAAHQNAAAYKTMAEGNLLTFRADKGSPTYRQLENKYHAEAVRLQSMLMKAGYPSAKVRGGKIGGILRLLFGGSGPMSAMQVMPRR